MLPTSIIKQSQFCVTASFAASYHFQDNPRSERSRLPCHFCCGIEEAVLVVVMSAEVMAFWTKNVDCRMGSTFHDQHRNLQESRGCSREHPTMELVRGTKCFCKGTRPNNRRGKNHRYTKEEQQQTDLPLKKLLKPKTSFPCPKVSLVGFQRISMERQESD